MKSFEVVRYDTGEVLCGTPTRALVFASYQYAAGVHGAVWAQSDGLGRWVLVDGPQRRGEARRVYVVEVE